MIESLAEHGVLPTDLVPALMTTHTVANPEFDPAAKRQYDEERAAAALDDTEDITSTPQPAAPSTLAIPPTPTTARGFQTTTRVLEDTSAAAMPGVSTSLSSTDENVTLDIRWTVLCDLFLLLVADSVYDARSRVLLEQVALKLGLGWLDVTKFERRVTDALEMQEGIDRLDQKDVIESRQQASKKRRYMMVGLATLGKLSMYRVAALRLTQAARSDRRRARYRSLCGSFGPGHRCWYRHSAGDCRRERHGGIPRRSRRRRSHHHGRCSYWVRYRWTGHGSSHTTG
jgi:hypothetical protein